MRSFSLALIIALWASAASAGYLALLHAGSGTGGILAPSFVLQTDGASFILLVDGTSKLMKEQP